MDWIIDAIPRWLGLGFAGVLALASAPPAHARETAADDSDRLAAHCARAGDGRESWSAPAPPARLYGNTYYVGTCGITVLLVTSPRGHVLLDGGPAAAAPLVAANITKLGFRLKDVRWIVSSHEHWDHVGALAELKRLTGAKVAAVPLAAPVLTSGKANADDPQHATADDFAPVRVDRILAGGEELVVGPLRLTAHVTPAHAPGSASWSWTSCAGKACRAIAYADSATIISADGYRFTEHPDRVAAARAGLAAIAALPCDILVTPHPGASDLFTRLAGGAPLIDDQACRAYAQRAGERFAQRLADEAGAAPR